MPMTAVARLVVRMVDRETLKREAAPSGVVPASSASAGLVVAVVGSSVGVGMTILGTKEGA
jgi:hypothetical protein